MYSTLDKPVNVMAYYFGKGAHLRSYPKRIEIDGCELDFLETGLMCLVKKGQQFTQIFNMSDGRKRYRLSFEPEAEQWKLLSVRGEN